MFFFSKSFWISWKINNVEIPGEIFYSNSFASPSIPTASWYDEYILRSSTWPFPCDQHIRRNLLRHKLLLAPIWSLDRCPTLISSVVVVNIPSLSHSEFLRNVLSLVFEWCWTRYRCSRILCSCRLPNSWGNTAQDDWWLSSTTPWTLSTSILSFCTILLRK